MNSVEAAEEHLLRFCQSEDQQVYAFKGRWGVGKSYLVRNLFQENHEWLPKYISYVSVFGLGSIREVREAIIGCREQRQSILGADLARPLGEAKKIFLSGVSKAKAALPYLPLELPDLSTAAFWHAAKQSDLLIVLDDLERANPSLQLDQLFGLVSSITENTQAKVLLVFNEEELSGDGARVLSRLREKVIDGEFTFRPSIADLVGKYLHEDTLRETVVACLSIKGGPNIRLIRRIEHGVNFFCTTLKELNLPMDEAMLRQVAKIIWHFHVSPAPLRDDASLALAIWGDGGVSDEEKGDEADQEATRLAHQAKMRAASSDKLMLEYLNHGYAPEELRQAFAKEQKMRHRSIELESKVNAVLHLYNRNFQCSGEMLAARLEELLELHCEELSLSQMASLTMILHGLERPTAPWWHRHVLAVSPTLTAEGCQSYLSRLIVLLTGPEARQTIEGRLDSLAPPFEPKATLIRIGTEGIVYDKDIQKLNALDASYYKEWFQTVEGDLFTPLAGFLKRIRNSPETVEGQLWQKIVGVLKELGDQSSANRLRVRDCFGVPVNSLA